MAAPAITLGSGQVLVTAADSTLGIVSITGDVIFGTIELVSDLEDGLILGDPVMFLKANSSRLMYGSTIYYLVENKNISGVEPPVP